MKDELAPAAPLRVLVVDDYTDTCDSMTLLLRLWGHETSMARDGPSAVKLADALQPDVVLLDIGLPLMDGYQVARHIRANPKLGQTLLVGLSGFGLEADRRRSLEAGCDLHWLKPVEPNLLRELLENWKATRDERRLSLC